jgi:hypothetical protein
VSTGSGEKNMANVSEPPTVPAEEPWVVSQAPGGAWSALINIEGEWIALGYFGAREDAEETIAACMQPGQGALG